MSDMSAFGGVSLLDLFKLEAESHGAALSSGLIAWEKSPTDVGLIEPLMRAAHSIKGSAGTPEKDPLRVDGLSGATITSNSVSRLTRFWMSADGWRPFLMNLRAGSTPR